MTGVSELLAVGRYEFRMQIRKRSLWLATLPLAALMVLGQGDAGPRYLPSTASPREVMGTWAILFGIALPIGFGMVLADRLVRDRRLGIAALLDSLPSGQGVLIAGKYLGGVAATALPGLLAMLAIFAGTRDLLLPWLAALAGAVGLLEVTLDRVLTEDQLVRRAWLAGPIWLGAWMVNTVIDATTNSAVGAFSLWMLLLSILTLWQASRRDSGKSHKANL